MEPVPAPRKARRVWSALRSSSLSLAFLGLFVVCIGGQLLAGHRAYNEEREDHGHAEVGFGSYVRSGHALEAIFENWESEFLQMGLFVLLTVKLYQRGSSESKAPEEPHESDEDPRKHAGDPGVPWPVRRGGFALKVYEHSLSIALLALFAVSFALHAITGCAKANEEAMVRGEPLKSLPEFVTSAQFWYESLQNWQSEFLSVFAIIVLAIFLRERGSPQSKPVAAPHLETGG